MEGKSELRARLLEQRKQLTPAQRCLWECDVSRALLRLPEYAAANTVLCYVSSHEEFSTAILLAHAISIGKQVGVPRWSCADGMVFCSFTDYRDLAPDRTGLLQPHADAQVIEPSVNTICVVPALAVDLRGYRLGYGGGYYDRFLADFCGFTVTPLHHGRLVDNLPVLPHDLPVECVVTPGQVHYTKRAEESKL